MGYNKGERAEYWANIRKNLEQVSKNDCVIGRTDNNGQISNDGDQNIEKYRKMGIR